MTLQFITCSVTSASKTFSLLQSKPLIHLSFFATHLNSYFQEQWFKSVNLQSRNHQNDFTKFTEMPRGDHSWLPKGSCLESKTRKIRATFCVVQAMIRYVTTYE